MNWGSVDVHKEYVTLKTHRYGTCFNRWQDGKSGRHNAFRSLLCRNLLEISLSSPRNVRSDEIEAQHHTSRSRLLDRIVPVVAPLGRHPGHRQTRHCDSLAPQGLATLLASDLEAGSWEAADLRGAAGAHSSAGRRERLGRAQDSS